MTKSIDNLSEDVLATHEEDFDLKDALGFTSFALSTFTTLGYQYNLAAKSAGNGRELPNIIGKDFVLGWPEWFQQHIGNGTKPLEYVTAPAIALPILSKICSFTISTLFGVEWKKSKEACNAATDFLMKTLIMGMVIGNVDVETVQILPYQWIDKMAHIILPESLQSNFYAGTPDLLDTVAGFAAIVGAAYVYDKLRAVLDESTSPVVEDVNSSV